MTNADPISDLSVLLHHDRYPRSNGYDPEWIIANQMGPHPLWLMEALTQSLAIDGSMRVLDLGCGTGLTSVPRSRVRRPGLGDRPVDQANSKPGAVSRRRGR